MSASIVDLIEPGCQDPLVGPIPHGSLFVVSGASGAGKTILAAQMMRAIKDGTPFCGYQTNPQPGYAVLAADRDWSTYRTIYERVGMLDHIKSYVLAEDKSFNPCDWGKKYQAIALFERCMGELAPDRGSIVYADPISPIFVQGNQNEARDVALSLLSYRKLAKRMDITLGVFANQAKQKVEDTYKRAQDRIAGSGAWVAYSDTQVAVEQDNGIVTMRWFPRLGAPTEHQFKFDPESGLFAPYEDGKESMVLVDGKPLAAHLARIYLIIPRDGTIPSVEILRAAIEQYQLKRRVIFKHLDTLSQLGLIERDSLGVYRRVVPH